MKKIVLLFISLFCFANLCAKDIEFPVSGLITVSPNPVKIKACWEDSWFAGNKSFEYNHGITRIAALLSEISYVNVLENPDNNELKTSYRLLGVKESNMEFHYNIDYSQQVYGANQAAFSIASKDISGPNGKRTLVFIVIRGTPYEASEWISNLEVNETNQKGSFVHDGFVKCTEQIHGALIYYLLKHKIDPAEASFFITGHSRGAAISNLLGMKLVSEGMFEKENIYVYTFACPNLIQLDEKIPESESGFIWNIINGEDVVPAVPPYRGKWYFQKYGHNRVIVNRWNVDSSLYLNQYLPRMNAYYNKLLGRDYCPFMSGTFIQTQATRVITDTYKTIQDYYSSFLNLPETTKKMVKKIFPEDVKKNGFTVDKFWEDFLTKLTNGGIDYAVNALIDMHACEQYLSWVMALNEEELFSNVGSTEIILEGFYECAVFDDDGNLLAQILDGAIQYEKTKAPIAVMPLSGKKIAIGFPEKENFTFIIYKESLIPSIISATIEKYDVGGLLLNTEEKNNLYPRIGIGLKFETGKDFSEDGKISLEKLSGDELAKWIQKGGLKQQEKFVVLPEILMDIDSQLWLGVHVGCRNIYGSFLTMQPVNNFGSILELSPGVGHQNDLFSNVMLDSEFYTRFIYVFKDSKQCGWNFVPELRFSVSFKPRNRFQIYATGIFDFEFKNFNEGPFSSKIRNHKNGAMEFGDVLKVVPTLGFGARF